MGLFAVLVPNENTQFIHRIEGVFPDSDRYRITPTQWVVSSRSTAQQVSDMLGISEGTPIGGVVFKITAYWGRSEPTLWEWMASKIEGSD